VTETTVFDHVLSRNILQNEMGCYIRAYYLLVGFRKTELGYF